MYGQNSIPWGNQAGSAAVPNYNYTNNLGWSDVGDVVDAGLGWVQGNFNNATANGAATAAINAAQANAINEAAKRRTQTANNIVKLVFLVIICVTVIAIFRSLKK